MTPEATLQRTLAKLLVRRRDLTKDAEAVGFASEHIGGNARVSPVEQVEIYREQYWLRHTGSLVEDFPGASGVLGQDDWERLVEEYLMENPPATFSLRELGERLPGFAETREWLPHRELVVDMARLEWAHVEVFDAEEAQPLAPEKLMTVPEDAWEGVRLVPSPALRLLSTRYPVLDLRRRILVAQSATESENGPTALPEPSAEHLAVHRRKLAIEHDRLDKTAFSLLSKVVSSMPLGAALEATASETGLPSDALTSKLEEWFATWSSRGYLIDIELP